MRVSRWVWLPTAALVAAVALSRTACAPKPVAVEVAAVERGPVEALVANSEAGSVRARQAAQLACDRGGRVVELPHREGEAVCAGDLLAQLDSTTSDAALHVARHELEVATASRGTAGAAATLAGEQYARAAELNRRGLLSTELFDQARSKRDGARSELRAAEARVATADAAVRARSNELAHLQLRAPFGGILSRRFIEVGETVVPGQAAFQIVALDRLYVVAPIDERDAGSLQPGQPVRVTLDAFPGVTWPATLTRIADVAEEARQQNRTVEVEVDLPELAGHPQPRPGLTADVEVVLSRLDSVLRVPTAAVIDGLRVLRVEGGRAAERPVTAGIRNWDWTEIRAGLAAGDRVVTTLDRAGVKDGARIRVEATPAETRP